MQATQNNKATSGPMAVLIDGWPASQPVDLAGLRPGDQVEINGHRLTDAELAGDTYVPAG